MKKRFKLISTLFAVLCFSSIMFAQDSYDSNMANTDTMMSVDSATEEVVEVMQEPEVDESKSFHQIIKEKFIEGGPGFMGIVLLCLILGLALSIERIIYLNLASQNKLEDYFIIKLNQKNSNLAVEVLEPETGHYH